jgi:hypothetical protein
MKITISEVLETNLFKTFFQLFLFHLLLMFLHMSLTSVQTFIHLQLNHDIATTETWLHANAWQTLAMVKGIGLLIFIKFLDATATIDISHIKKSIKNLAFDRELLVVVFFVHLSLISIEQLTTNDVFSVVDISWISLLGGNFLFYFADVYLLLKILDKYDLTPKQINWPWLLGFFLLNMISVSVMIPFARGVNLLALLHILFIAIFVFNSTAFLSSFVMYFTLIILPLSVIYPLDIIYGDEISIFNYQNPMKPVLLVSIWLISIAYFVITKKRRLID